MVTADDVEVEHRLAMQSLNSAQRRAFARMADARWQANLTHTSEATALKDVFQQEASARNRRKSAG